MYKSIFKKNIWFYNIESFNQYAIYILVLFVNIFIVVFRLKYFSCISSLTEQEFFEAIVIELFLNVVFH